MLPKQSNPSLPCPYCRKVYLDPTGNKRVNRACEPNGIESNYFVLTPIMEWYYKKKHPDYKRLPPYRADCMVNTEEFPIRLIYPKKLSEIFIPVDFDGNQEKIVFEASHRNEELTIYWHLDQQMVGTTKEFHQLELRPSPGEHVLTLIDELGNEFSQKIIVLEG
jgi:penicillin-binding protein 1C